MLPAAAKYNPTMSHASALAESFTRMSRFRIEQGRVLDVIPADPPKRLS